MSTKLHTGWIAVDLDGTLAQYDKWRGPEHIGEPIPLMLGRVKAWLEMGRDVRIFTARVGPADRSLVSEDYPQDVVRHIEAWCLKHVGQVLPVTCVKDFSMDELWDDRAVQVLSNTGLTFRHPVPIWKMWRRFQAYFRLDLTIVCQESKRMGLIDYHDYMDDALKSPSQGLTLECERCGKKFNC